MKSPSGVMDALLTGLKKHKKEGEALTKREEKECEVDDVFLQLKKFDTPKLRLWARTMCENLHNDIDNPPGLRAFHGNNQTPKN